MTINQSNVTRISSAIEKGISHLPIFPPSPCSISQQLYVMVRPVGDVVGEYVGTGGRGGQDGIWMWQRVSYTMLGFVMRTDRM
jgi:hypothetical protein